MDATGSDVESPFLPRQDPDVAGQPRPLLDYEVMRRLRTPLEADPFDALDQQRVVSSMKTTPQLRRRDREGI